LEIPVSGSRWAANTALLNAAVLVDELYPDRPRGHGQMPYEVHGLLETIRTDAHSLICKLQTYSVKVATQTWSCAFDQSRV
jgi:hypothetical protein